MIPRILSLTQIIAVISFFNVDSVISSNTYVSNLLKNHFHFKVMLSNIKNPDESREKRGNVRFHCQGRGDGDGIILREAPATLRPFLFGGRGEGEWEWERLIGI